MSNTHKVLLILLAILGISTGLLIGALRARITQPNGKDTLTAGQTAEEGSLQPSENTIIEKTLVNSTSFTDEQLHDLARIFQQIFPEEESFQLVEVYLTPTGKLMAPMLAQAKIKELNLSPSKEQLENMWQQAQQFTSANQPDSPLTANAQTDLPLLDDKHLSFDRNVNSSKLKITSTTRSSTMCNLLESSVSYIHPVCTLNIYEDQTRSAVLFDQHILRERLDFQDADYTPLQKITIHENGKTIHKQITYLPDGKRKELTFSDDGTLLSVDLTNAHKQAQHIIYPTQGNFAWPVELTITHDAQQITYTLTKPESYEKTVHENNEITQAPPAISWQVNDKGQAVLEDGRIFPPRDFWGAAPQYCRLYPQDCITQ